MKRKSQLTVRKVTRLRLAKETVRALSLPYESLPLVLGGQPQGPATKKPCDG